MPLHQQLARPCYPNSAYDQSQLELIGALVTSLLSLVAQELGMRIPVLNKNIEGWAILFFEFIEREIRC